METADVLRALAALSQESRLGVFRLLVQSGSKGRIAGEIAQKLDLANATLSFHLKELANAGLIEARQNGRYIHYSANYARMNELLGYLTENCCAGDAAACAAECAPTRRPKSINTGPGRSHPKRRVATR